MPRAGPKSTIPPAAERPAATRRWPLQVLAGVAAIGTLFLLMRWLNEGTEPTRAASSAGDSPVTSGERRDEPRQAPQQAAPAVVEPGDAQFVAQLERSAARHLLRDTPYTTAVAELVAAVRIADAAALLDAGSTAGDRDATVVLLQLRMLCESPEAKGADPEPAGGSLERELARAAPVPADLRRRIGLSVETESARRLKLQRACADARFNALAIEQRVRSAAQAGHEPSLWALGRYFDDAEQRERHWLSAAMLGYPAAQSALAESLLEENLRGDRRNRGRMNFWLQAAAKHSPQVKAKLGECALNGCNAQPPDAEGAVPLLRDAALLGELTAFDALASVSKGEEVAPSDEELYGLQVFLQRLNDTGCYGAAAYPGAALKGLRSLKEIGSRISPHALQDAEQRAAAHWREHGAAARRAQGCD